MFERVTLRGARASIVWGYRTAAALSTWTISKEETRWVLRATFEGACDRFMLRQTKPTLIFTAPRHYGHSCWPIAGDVQIGERHLVATLGPPEQ